MDLIGKDWIIKDRIGNNLTGKEWIGTHLMKKKDNGNGLDWKGLDWIGKDWI